MERTLILGIGNTLMGDDGVGIRIVKDLDTELRDAADLQVTEEMGLSLLDILTGYRQVICIDSSHSGENEVGHVQLYPLEEFEDSMGPSNHYLGLPEIIHVANELNVPFPEKIFLIGIEINHANYIRDELSEHLAKIYPDILHKCRLVIDDILNIKQVSPTP